MSDSVAGVSVHAEAPGVAGGRTAGTLLREARMEAGLHIAALAVALKVPVAKLEALEADNFAVLPDTVFVRALASSVCRTLKIDSAPRSSCSFRPTAIRSAAVRMTRCLPLHP
jgi:cytoskeleton protein RodZ